MNLVFFLNSILLGVGLAMDAFSVSMANALIEKDMRLPRMFAIAGVYAFFQFAMPMVGWICVHTIVEHFRSFEKFIPWIALVLLLYIGGEMLIDGIRCNASGSCDIKSSKISFAKLLVQGVATSIDALSVGFTIADYTVLPALVASLIIAVVTFAICLCGLFIGKKAKSLLADKASILGGVILIEIGIEIFVSGVFF